MKTHSVHDTNVPGNIRPNLKMPRKSTSSISAGDTNESLPSAVNGAAGLMKDGHTSVVSAATDASTAAKPKANVKAPKEDADSVGVDVCVKMILPPAKLYRRLSLTK
jgi:hypothetical protein